MLSVNVDESQAPRLLGTGGGPDEVWFLLRKKKKKLMKLLIFPYGLVARQQEYEGSDRAFLLAEMTVKRAKQRRQCLTLPTGVQEDVKQMTFGRMEWGGRSFPDGGRMRAELGSGALR